VTRGRREDQKLGFIMKVDCNLNYEEILVGLDCAFLEIQLSDDCLFWIPSAAPVWLRASHNPAAEMGFCTSGYSTFCLYHRTVLFNPQLTSHALTC